jgi:hypothetical protein
VPGRCGSAGRQPIQDLVNQMIASTDFGITRILTQFCFTSKL